MSTQQLVGHDNPTSETIIVAGINSATGLSTAPIPVSVVSNYTDQRSERELMMSINDRLGALLILMANAFAPGDTPETLLNAASDNLRIVS